MLTGILHYFISLALVASESIAIASEPSQARGKIVNYIFEQIIVSKYIHLVDFKICITGVLHNQKDI